MIAATLLTDGASDVVLVRILEWVIAQQTRTDVDVKWADLRGMRYPPHSLPDRLRAAVALYPCEVLFVHRDAENQSPEARYNEIATANVTGRDHVGVVPVRMQEAWLLHNEPALREAAGRPSDTTALLLPAPDRWETLPDPKEVLRNALVVASGAQGRHARRFRPNRAVHRLAELITDWTPLRGLTAFQRLEADTRLALSRLGVVLDGPGVPA
jgi:hypothetical protein